jgi:Holliday junction resolvasome RuvABC endonuclease subunit
VISLGIDCATKSGWALVEQAKGGERLVEYGVLDLDRPDAWNPVAWLALHCRAGFTPTLKLDAVAIELPWLGKNPHTLEVLARLCGRFEQAFEPSGADIRVVRAVEWQTAILGRFGGKTRAGLKLAAVAWAKGTFGVSLPSDAADAAGLAVFALRTARARKLGIR